MKNVPTQSTASASLWHTKSIKKTFEKLDSQEDGLTHIEVRERLARIGPNKLPKEKHRSLFFVFLQQFRSPLIYILIVADIAVFLLGESIDGYIILFILVFNAVLGTIQEGRAERTLSALKQFTETEATVIRHNKKFTIPDEEVVPGDVILLQEGEKIPADARVIASQNLKTEEAALTGESIPVRKIVDPLESPILPTSEQKNMVFKGTTIAVGYGKAVVVATGIQTVIGKISKRIAEIDTEIPLAKNIRHLANIVVILVAALITLIFAMGVFGGNDIKEMFVAAIAIAVAAVPEGLPLVLTVILAAGVWRMAKRRVLVKKLQAVESLGQARVIAVDKTGTITKNELTIQDVFIGNTTFPVEGKGYAPTPRIAQPEDDLMIAGKVAAFCSHAYIASLKTGTYKVIGDPTEGAMSVFAEKLGIEKEELLKEYQLLNDWPFDYQKKYHVALYKKQVPFLAIAGAPEVIISLCNTYLQKGDLTSFDISEKERIKEEFYSLSRKGKRVIAFGFLDNAPEEIDIDRLPPLTFGGLYIMQDPLRENIEREIARANKADIKIVMITGDHKITAQAIAKEAGIYKDGDMILTGPEINSFSPQEFQEKLTNISVFARVTPEHKVRIIEAYREKGEVIAMTGDGVNDAPSLVAADLGIAMGKIGTEVTKEAGDLVLMDDNFGDILSAVEEGRNMRYGIRRTLTYLFSSNLGEILLIGAALVLRLPLPLLAAQIVWMNLVTDTFFDISLALEPKEKSLMKRGAKIPKKLFDKLVAGRLSLIAPVMAAGAFFFFLQNLSDLTKARTLALTGLVIFQWFNAWNCRSESKSVFSINPFSNKFLLFTFLWVIVLHGFALYHPFMNNILRTVPLTFYEILPLIGLAFSVILVEEIRKYIMRMHLSPK